MLLVITFQLKKIINVGIEAIKNKIDGILIFLLYISKSNIKT